MNRKRLEQAKERLMTVVDPKRFNMHEWQIIPDWGDKYSSRVNLTTHKCNTVGCFAGWLPAMFNRSKVMKDLLADEELYWEDIVEDFFELNGNQADYIYGEMNYSHSDVEPKHVCEHIDDVLNGSIA